MIHTVELKQAPRAPWRNGGGMTQELLAWPSPIDWQFRVSVARIEKDGTFSAYPGVMRWFAVVEGEGVLLRFAECENKLKAGSEALGFDGDNPPACELLNGATSNLNFMVRCEAGHGEMLGAVAGKAWRSDARFRAVFTMEPARLQIDGNDAGGLEAGTLAWSSAAAEESWCLASPAPVRAWWLGLRS